jgi:hypothetical protein
MSNESITITDLLIAELINCKVQWKTSIELTELMFGVHVPGPQVLMPLPFFFPFLQVMFMSSAPKQ